MEPEELLRILSRAGRLKMTTRHCYTEEGRKESVADHSWRIALMAMLMTSIDEYRDLDMNKVIRMCLIHDLGESFTGDIPTFEKTDDDAGIEDSLFLNWVRTFPEPQRSEWEGLLHEMDAPEDAGSQALQGPGQTGGSHFPQRIRYKDMASFGI